MKVTPILSDMERSKLECMKQSALKFVIDHLMSSLELFERDPPDSDFDLGYEQAQHDTMVELLRHMLEVLELPSTERTTPQDSADNQYQQGNEQAPSAIEFHLIGRRPEDTLH